MGMNVLREKLSEVRRNEVARKQWLERRKDALFQTNDSMLCGHFIFDGVRPKEWLESEIQSGKVRLVTLLRDPLERAISACFYRKKRGLETFPTLEARLKAMKNPISRHLGYQGENPELFLKNFYFLA